MDTLTGDDLTTLVVGAILLACGIATLGSKWNIIVKVIAAVIGFAGLVLVFHSIPANELHLEISLVLAIFMVVVGALLFNFHKLIGGVVITVGVLAFIGGGYWDAQIPVIHMSLASIWNTGWEAVKEVFGQGNHGLNHLKNK